MLARFIPVVRTVLNPLAGVLAVPPRAFTVWQISGGVLWSAGVTLTGYTLGSAVPGVDQYLLPAIVVIVIVSLAPVAMELRRAHSAPHADTDQVSDHGGRERPRMPGGPVLHRDAPPSPTVAGHSGEPVPP